MRIVDCKLYVCILFIAFAIHGISYSQSDDYSIKNQSLLDTISHIYGSSELLVNGSVYYQPNRQAAGTPFLFSSETEQGKVYTRGIEFNGVNINMNVNSKKLLLLNSMPDGSRLLIDLSDMLIDSFLIRDYFFIAPAKLNIKSNYPYLQVINSGRYVMYIAYDKEFINRFNNKYPYGKYSSVKRTLFLVSDSIPLRIKSKRTLLNSFPSARKDISTYLRKNKIKLSRATTDQLKRLMEFYNRQRELRNE